MTTQREKSDRQNAKVDEKILRLIHELRHEYQACTLRHLASHMRITETAVRNRMNRMRGQYLDWNKMPGSVHLLPAGYERAGIVVVEVELEAVTAAPPTPCCCGVIADTLGAAGVEIGNVYHRADGPCYYVAPGTTPEDALVALTALTATTTASPDQAAQEDREAPTSPEGSPAGTPDTDQDPGPASPSAS